MTSAVLLAARVRTHRFAVLNEDHLQQALAELLGGRREVNLTAGGRVDLLLDDVAIEVKVAGSAEAVLRQVQRYAKSDEVREVLVVSTCSGHAHLPGEVSGKRLVVVLAKGAI